LGVYGGYFCLSRDIFASCCIENQGLSMRFEIGGRFFEKSAHLLVESPGKRVFSAFAGTSFEYNSDKPLRHAFFDEALCLDIGIPGVFGVAVDRVSVCLKLKIVSWPVVISI
jgi:hypothetical protein